MKVTNYNEFAANVEAAVKSVTDMTGTLFDASQIYAGTLFVECNASNAAKIETALIEKLKCGVIVSKVGPEFSFDFV